MNAVSNATKYTPVGARGGITIAAHIDAGARGAAAAAAAAAAPPAAPSLVVEVTDCGLGLRGQTLSQLVTEFGGIGSESARQGVIRSSGTGHPDVRDVR